MPWWNFLKEIFSFSKRQDPPRGVEAVEEAFSNWATDQLFLWLGIFTHIYGIVIGLLFFLKLGEALPNLVSILDALRDPYLGGLGVYVVLKEIKKRRLQETKGSHLGEIFVGLWLLLLVISSAVVLFDPTYHFNILYKLIITNSLASLVIYIGGAIHRP